MGLITKGVAILFGLIFLVVTTGKYFFYVIGIGLLIFILIVVIRLIADGYWWGKDKGKW